jgi:choline dehydrogenase-like flavoprotein
MHARRVLAARHRAGASITRAVDQELAADAVVVGTGAGGATAAARLQDAGLDVRMLEEGGLHYFSSHPEAVDARGVLTGHLAQGFGAVPRQR